MRGRSPAAKDLKRRRVSRTVSLADIIGASVRFAGKEIFSDIRFQVEPGDRIGLVGRNGSGKTTLLRLLAGELKPDRGEVRIARGTRVGYLPQDIHEVLAGPLLQSILDSIRERPRLREMLRKTEAALARANDSREQSRLAVKLAEIHHDLDLLEQEYPSHLAQKILTGLGFSPDDLEAPASSLSGGWKMRAALAGLLYRKPDLLLLDEPTNHLDIPAVRWLEEFLESFSNAVILVSHDRDFLNRQVRRILSFEPEGVRSYSGNYDFYVKARRQEQRALEAKARNVEQKVKEAQKFIDRFRAKASKARQAQSKAKFVKKLELVRTHKKEKTIRFSFPEVPRSGKVVMTLREITKGFGEKVLYRDVTMNIQRGDRVAVIGPNGSGKTTLLRLVAGELEPDRGEVRFGHGVKMGYFAQHHSEMLNPDRSVLEEVYDIVPEESLGFVRSVCGAFLFSGSDVEKRVGVLSGGEKARVALARLLVKPGNFMVMDEPTNHLDLVSSEMLIEALGDYGGTLLFVSHNQAFVNRLATRIWDIREGAIHDYPGSLYDYYEHLKRIEQKKMPPDEKESTRGGGSGRARGPDAAHRSRANRKTLKRERAERRRMIREIVGPLQAELEGLEERIGDLEKKQKEIEKVLADPEFFKDKERSVPMLRDYRDTRSRLEELMERWEQGQDRLEKIKKELGVD
ncbi:MAG: ABC-F family ATP-binding cassette domain-containing protein [Deltaproteobacteria bacterium]|nr:ABC-F family ATP-binding cassette domain-containing protein [Deltaproteobacteria bacterium]